jgi:hypothetical protein
MMVSISAKTVKSLLTARSSLLGQWFGHQVRVTT